MTPYIAKIMPTKYLMLWRCLDNIIARLPDLDLGRDAKGEKIVLSCHMLARAIGRTLKLKVIDGEFGNGFAHSWLVTNDSQLIIDPYPVGIFGGPLIVDATFANAPGRTLYTEKRKICKQLAFSSPEFRRSVQLIFTEIQKII
jgi:hypothetical protein